MADRQSMSEKREQFRRQVRMAVTTIKRIVDGRVAFTGGAGIADHWRGNARGPDEWRDIQIRLEGPAVVPCLGVRGPAARRLRAAPDSAGTGIARKEILRRASHGPISQS